MTERSPLSTFRRHLRRRLASGFLVIVPLAVTLLVLKLLVSFFVALEHPFVLPWIGKTPKSVLVLIAGLVTVALVYLIGLATTHIVGRRLLHGGEALLLKLPFVKGVYAASKHVMHSMSSSNREAFKAVALVEFPCKGTLAVAMVTGTVAGPDGKPLYRVFVSSAPNPMHGFFLTLPEEDLQFTDISVDDGLKMIVSCGLLSPQTYRACPPPEKLGKSL